jgi:hypothetical protein
MRANDRSRERKVAITSSKTGAFAIDSSLSSFLLSSCSAEERGVAEIGPVGLRRGGMRESKQEAEHRRLESADGLAADVFVGCFLPALLQRSSSAVATHSNLTMQRKYECERTGKSWGELFGKYYES